jgi:F0F1-type ATP synthase assembly protein I
LEKWKGYGRQIRSAYSYSAVGLEMGLAVAVGYFLGSWVEGQTGWAPWGVIGGVVLGSVAAFLSLFRTLKRLQRQVEGGSDDT